MDQLTLLKGDKGFEMAVPHKENWVFLREEGYSPIQSLVSSTAACGGYVYTEILKNSNIEHDFEKIEVSYTRDETTKVKAIQSIHMIFYVKIAEVDRAKAETALKLVSRYCPVIQSLNPTIQISESVKFI